MRIATIFVLALAALVSGSAPAAAQYPTPLPDFAHPSRPHAPLLSPSGGTRDRPLLAVYLGFTDPDFNANVDGGILAGRVRAAMDYLRRSSFGQLDIAPAREDDSSGNGAANDGVVRAKLDMTRAQYGAKTPAEQIKLGLQAVDGSVDFKQFDANGDESIGNDELVIHVFQSGALPLPGGCGAVFPKPSPSSTSRSTPRGSPALPGLGCST